MSPARSNVSASLSGFISTLKLPTPNCPRRQAHDPLTRCLRAVAVALVLGLKPGGLPRWLQHRFVSAATKWAWPVPQACSFRGTGGTGARSENGGIGGTGAPSRNALAAPAALARWPKVDGTYFDHGNGGVGGTGAPILRPGGTGGTGIVGTITGFASICVNGMEVHYGKDVPVSENGAPASSAHLAIGQVVAVEAIATQRGLQAGRISILNVYEGPLTALPNASAPLRVMGQPVAARRRRAGG